MIHWFGVSSPASTGMPRRTVLLVARTLATVVAASSLFACAPRSGAGKPKDSPSRVRDWQPLRVPDEAPVWAIRYGAEYWHQHSAAGKHPVMGDVVERVSHAFRPNAAGRQEAAGAGYRARLDSSGLTFVPTTASGGADTGLRNPDGASRGRRRPTVRAGRRQPGWVPVGKHRTAAPIGRAWRARALRGHRQRRRGDLERGTAADR